MPRRLPQERRALMQVHDRLLAAHGPQHWWPARTPFEVIAGAILTQNTSWRNVESALSNLRAAGALSARSFRELPLEQLAAMVYPAGYFNSKARKLRAIAQQIGKYGDDLGAMFNSKPLGELREELLDVHGVGPETADSILLYAGGLPTFVVDAYTTRILVRLKLLSVGTPYGETQALFHRSLPREAPLFNEFHALLVAHGKDACLKREPRCDGCPLLDMCPTGRARRRVLLTDSSRTTRRTHAALIAGG